MQRLTKNRAHYLSVIPRDKSWGFYVTAVGSREAPPRCIDFFADDTRWKKGRVLPDYAMVYLSAGGGVFQSKDTGTQEVKAGDVFLLFPGVWHNYHPGAKTGWNEYWVQFNGVHPERLVEHRILSPRSPIFHVGEDSAVSELFVRVLDAAATQPVTANQVIASLTMTILASVLVTTHVFAGEGDKTDPEIQKARYFLEERLREDVDMAALAQSLNLSYRHFRRLFKDATGIGPQHYHTQMRINRAKELLEDPYLRINEVASMLGFPDAYYFSRLFRKSTGLSPTQWRATRGRIVP